MYTSDELNKLVEEFYDKFENQLKNGFKNITVSVKFIDNRICYFYEFDNIPVHKCIAIKVLRLLYPDEDAYKEDFDDTYFN